MISTFRDGSFLHKLFADGSYQGPQFATVVAAMMLQLSVEIVKRSYQARGFCGLTVSCSTAGTARHAMPRDRSDEACPKCHGQHHVYYLHAGQPCVDVVGGKRMTCPVCAGTGSVRTSLRTTAERG